MGSRAEHYLYNTTAEYGQVYRYERYEQSGVLTGLMRTRCAAVLAQEACRSHRAAAVYSSVTHPSEAFLTFLMYLYRVPRVAL
jgi:threonyl-tRNA synthetase